MARLNYSLNGSTLNLSIKDMSVQELVDFLTGLVLALPAATRHQMFLEWRNLLAGTGKPRPLVVALEDMVRKGIDDRESLQDGM